MKVWHYPDVQQKSPSDQEMILMEFVLKDEKWVHSKYPEIQYTKEEVKNKTFREVEQAVLNRKNETESR